MTSEQIYLETLTNGGSSTNRLNQKPTAGYMVSVPDESVIVPIDDREAAIEAISAHRKSIAQRTHLPYYVGTWVDNGQIFIDVSVQIDNLEHALDVGRTFEQIAIYDVVNQQSINCY